MPDLLRALVLEDNRADLDLLLHELRRAGFEIDAQHVDDKASYAASLSADVDVILADYALPQFDAAHALLLLQQRGLDVPFIVVTGSVSEEAAVECMKLGAADYLLKDRLARLGPAVRQALEAKRLRDERRRAQQEVHRRNRELTLLNRVIAASAEGLEDKDILQIACRELSAALGVPRVVAALFDSDKSSVVIVGEHLADGAPSVLGQIIALGDAVPLAELLVLKAPLIVDAASSDPRLELIRSLVLESGLASLLFVPLIVAGEVVGGVGLGTCEERRFSREDVDLVRSVADQLSGALARAQLEQEHRRLSTAIEQTADSVIITEPDGTILYVNPGFELITGYRRAEAVGRSIRMLESHAREDALEDDVMGALRARKNWRGRVVNAKKEGSLYTADVSITSVRDESGEVVSYVHVQRDITHELELEQRYLQAQKMEAVGRLAGGIAHDFNNLLTAITGYTELLLDDASLGGPGNADLNEIAKAAGRAAALTNQLLAFSRKQILRPKMLDLNVLVRDLENMLHRLIGEDIALRTDLAPHVGKVRADPGQIEQVIMNLVVNARDAMPDGGELVLATADVDLDAAFVREHPGSLPGWYVMLSVADTGLGMDEQVLSHLFEPFFTTKEQGKGTGLGLATVYGIVKQSDGYIWPSSELGKGTTFEVYLPRVTGKDDGSDDKSEAESLPVGQETILLVEDDDMVRGLACRVLERQGYTVLAADHPDHALQLSEEYSGPIDLLISDVIMPGMSGREMADLVSARHPEIDVLYISGYMDDTIFHRGVRDPGTAFLPKPFTPAMLTHKVREVLDR